MPILGVSKMHSRGPVQENQVEVTFERKKKVIEMLRVYCIWKKGLMTVRYKPCDNIRFAAGFLRQQNRYQ